MNKVGRLPAVLAAFMSLSSPALADAKLQALGRHLAQECTTCHKPDGANAAIPPLAGLEVDYFVQTMNFYKDGARNNPVMVSVAQSLDPEQIKALALYFASLPVAGKPAGDAAKPIGNVTKTKKP